MLPSSAATAALESKLLQLEMLVLHLYKGKGEGVSKAGRESGWVEGRGEGRKG